MFLFYSVGSSGPCQSAVVRLILGINMAAFPLVVVVVVYSTRVRVYPICLPLYDPISTTHFHSFLFFLFLCSSSAKRAKQKLLYVISICLSSGFNHFQVCNSVPVLLALVFSRHKSNQISAIFLLTILDNFLGQVSGKSRRVFYYYYFFFLRDKTTAGG